MSIRAILDEYSGPACIGALAIVFVIMFLIGILLAFS